MAEFRVLDTSKFANAANATKTLVEALESDLHITASTPYGIECL